MILMLNAFLQIDNNHMKIYHYFSLHFSQVLLIQILTKNQIVYSILLSGMAKQLQKMLKELTQRKSNTDLEVYHKRDYNNNQ